MGTCFGKPTDAEPANVKHVVFHDDLTDSDNWIAARAVFLATRDNPNVRVHWIVEPRVFRLGFGCLSKDQEDELVDLIEQYFPERCDGLRKGAVKLMLQGRLTQEDIDKRVEDPKHRRHLRFAIRPTQGPDEDAVSHGRLTAYDFLTALMEWTAAEGGQAVEAPLVHLDTRSVETNQNLVNLNIHHHEELIARTPAEVEAHRSLMAEPDMRAREQGLRGWYRGCTERLRASSASRGGSVRDLDRTWLVQLVRKAKLPVLFFGGSSLNLLAHVAEQGGAKVMGNLECYLQAGAFDLTTNIFGNQFNLALNPAAAQYVFKQHDKFRRFVTSPTDTTQNVRYTLGALSRGGGPALAKRFVGFNKCKDPMDIAKGKETTEMYADELCSMPDLTAFACVFLKPNEFKGWTDTRAKLQVSQTTGAMPFVREKGAFCVREIRTAVKDNKVDLTDEEVRVIFDKLRGRISVAS